MDGETELNMQLSSVENGWAIWHVSSIGVNIKRGGKGNETTAWVSLSVPTDRAFPVARRVDYTEAPQPENTLPFAEIRETLTALLEQVEDALKNKGETGDW